MNIAVQDQSTTRKNLVVTLDANEVAAEHQATVAEFSRFARIPGFRPGKAPADMVTKRFAKEIGDEFKQKVMSKAYRSGLEQSKLDVLNLVDAKQGDLASGQGTEITFVLDIRPDFSLPDYVGLTTEVAPTDATDAEVDFVIEQLRSERADFKVAERAAAKGDYVKLSYEGKVDGQDIAELAPDKQLYGKVPQTWEEIDGEQEGLIPGLGRQLSGLKSGEKRDVTITFPAEFAPVPALAGKTAVYSVEILEVRERVLPPMDADFFKSQQADDLDGLKTNVRNRLKQQKEFQNRSGQRRQVVDQLLSKVEFEVPDSLVNAETQSVLRQVIEDNLRRGVPQEQLESEKKGLFENSRRAAATRVKSQLVLAKIAEKEGLKVSENDINAYIYQESMRSGTSGDRLVKQLSKDREQLRAVQQSIIFDKAVEFLVSKATVTTVQPKA